MICTGVDQHGFDSVVELHRTILLHFEIRYAFVLIQGRLVGSFDIPHNAVNTGTSAGRYLWAVVVERAIRDDHQDHRRENWLDARRIEFAEDKAAVIFQIQESDCGDKVAGSLRTASTPTNLPTTDAGKGEIFRHLRTDCSILFIKTALEGKT